MSNRSDYDGYKALYQAITSKTEPGANMTTKRKTRVPKPIRVADTLMGDASGVKAQSETRNLGDSIRNIFDLPESGQSEAVPAVVVHDILPDDGSDGDYMPPPLPASPSGNPFGLGSMSHTIVSGGKSVPAYVGEFRATTSGRSSKSKSSTPVGDLAGMISRTSPAESQIVPGDDPADRQDFDDLRETLTVQRVAENTVVYAVVIDAKKPEESPIQAIPCRGGTGYGGYVYDRARDSYLVACVEILPVGEVPLGLVVSQPQVGGWRVSVPLPAKVIERHMTPNQRGLVQGLQARYQDKRYEVHYVQMVGCR